jgi:tetraacyldisaccharide 4'-kinase
MNRENLIVKILLLPLSFVYYLITSVRNILFDWKVLPSERFHIPIICVGNISVGGTGKTPFAEYLIRILNNKYKVAVLSRGYKRKTKGFLIVRNNSPVTDAGDESRQIKQKYPDIIVAVDGNRRRGIRQLLALENKPDVIILDDAMQHRYVCPSLTIMLTQYDNMYYNDYILPVGNLRESVIGSYRADVVVVTKCPPVIKPIDLRIIEKNLKLLASQRLYFSKVCYNKIEPVFPSDSISSFTLPDIKGEDDLLIIAGIANPRPFIEMFKSFSKNVQVCDFSDHHNFNESDYDRIRTKFLKMNVNTRKIVCTEKDAQRLKSDVNVPDELKPYLYFQPILVELLFDQSESFEKFILKHVLSTINM